MNRRLWVAGIPVDAVPAAGEFVPALLGRSARGSLAVTFVNPQSPLTARRSRQYARDLAACDFVCPDGIGIVLAARLVGHGRIHRISMDSTSLATPLFDAASGKGHPVLLLGAGPGVGQRAAETLRGKWPTLKVSALDGDFSAADALALAKSTRPRIVLIAMGIGKQEALALRLREACRNTLVITCGGYLDQLSGGFQYYPAWVDRLHLRWLYRIWREPRRLLRRYLVAYPYCAWALLRHGRKPRLDVLEETSKQP